MTETQTPIRKKPGSKQKVTHEQVKVSLSERVPQVVLKYEPENEEPMSTANAVEMKRNKDLLMQPLLKLREQ